MNDMFSEHYLDNSLIFKNIKNYKKISKDRIFPTATLPKMDFRKGTFFLCSIKK